jgi:hypothetical protein
MSYHKFVPKISSLLLLFWVPIIGLAAESQSDTSSTLKSSVISIFALVVVLGAAKCFLMSKRKETSSICVISLGLVLLGWSFSLILSIFEELGPAYKGVLAAIAILCTLVGIIIALVGLIQYRQDAGYNQGKSQAIFALVIGVIFIAVTTISAVDTFQKRMNNQNASTNAQQKEQTYEQLNFNYVIPNSNYTKINKDRINEDATIVIERSFPNIYFMIIAENPGPEVFDLESLEELVISNIKNASSNTIINSTKTRFLNGMEGTSLDIDAKVQNQDISYQYWVYEKNGFVYQLIAWSRKNKKKQLQQEYEKLIAGFHLLSQDKIALPENKSLLLSSRSNLGISLDATDINWMAWDGLEQDYPLAMFGGEIGGIGYFQVTPYCYLDSPPHQSATRTALLHPFGIEYPQQSFVKDGALSFGELTGEKYSYQWELDEGMHEARYTFVQSENCTTLIALWTNSTKEKTDQHNEKLLRMLSFDKSFNGVLTPPQKLNTASLHNYTGLSYYRKKNYIQAIEFFKLAAEFNSADALYVNNLFDSYNSSSNYNGAIQYFENNKENLVLDADGESWLAWFYQNIDNLEQSKKHYKLAFESGFRNDDDLGRYIDLLLAGDNFSLADTSLRDFADKPNSPTIAVKKSQIKRQIKDYDAALKIIRDSTIENPFNSELIFEEIYIHNDRAEYENIITLANSLINEGYESAGAHYQKGKAEYNLGWYIQSKKSFESALKYAPKNENILDFINTVSGLLGEGESTSISHKIEPVDFPSFEVEDKISSLEKNQYDSYFIQKLSAYSFVVGERLRETKMRRIKIISNQGVKRFSTIELEFNPLYERAYINQLVVKDDKENTLYSADRNEFYVTDSGGNEANTNKTIHLPVANLAPGTIIEYIYTTETLSPLTEFPFTHLYHSSSRPVAESLVYIAGDIKDITHQQVKSAPPITKKNSLLWRHISPEPYVNEPMQINSSVFLPSITIGQKDSEWKVLADNYLKSMDEKLVVTDEIISLSKDLTKGTKNNEEKIAILSAYVQDNITYKAIEFGVRGRMPNSPSTVIEERYGDCKDHAVLLRALLKGSNIEANLALVNVSDSVNPEFPSLDQFDHMITYLPNFKQGQFIDTTDKSMALTTRIPRGLGDSNALVMDKAKSHVKKIARHSTRDNILKSIREIQIEDTHHSRIKESFILSGYMEGSFRSFLREIEPGERFNWAKQFIASLDRKMELVSMNIENLSDTSRALQLDLEFKLDNKQTDDGTILFEDSSIWEYYYLIPKTVDNRKTDFQIRYPVNFTSQVKVTAPQGYSIRSNSLKGKKEESPFGLFELGFDIGNNSLLKTFKLSENNGEYPRADYKSYYEFAKNAVDISSKTLVFTLKKDD